MKTFALVAIGWITAILFVTILNTGPTQYDPAAIKFQVHEDSWPQQSPNHFDLKQPGTTVPVNIVGITNEQFIRATVHFEDQYLAWQGTVIQEATSSKQPSYETHYYECTLIRPQSRYSAPGAYPKRC